MKRHVFRLVVLLVLVCSVVPLFPRPIALAAITIDPVQRSVTTSRFFMDWSKVTTTDPEEISLINWPVPHSGANLTNVYGGEFFGDGEGWVSGAYPGGSSAVGLVNDRNTGTWTQSAANTITTTSDNPSVGVPVTTQYAFSDTSDIVWVQRTFHFGSAPFPYDVRPYEPRLYPRSTYYQVLYPSTNGSLTSANAGDCEAGCVPGDWDASHGTLLLRNLTTGATTTLALPPDIGSVDEVHVVQDGAGNIAAVFTAQATQRDLYVSYNDQADNLWGAPVQLTDDTNEEASPTAGLDSSGNLLAAYASTAIVPVAHTVTVNGQTITYTVPTRGQTNLITLSHAFAKNLTLTDTDLALSDDRPAPGATVTISATVRNTGDLPLSGVTVDFYDGNPAAGGTTISTVPVPGILAAGGAATLTVPYTVPTTGGPHTLYAVADPSHSIAGANEQNTTGKITAFGPDLDLSQATVAYWGGSTVGIQTTISNIGTSTAPASTLAVYAGSLTGTRLLTNTVPPLAAGQTLTLTTPWNFGARAAGAYPLALAVNQSDFPEANQTNNTAGATLDVAPDLMVSPYYLSTSQSAGGAIQLSATVFNVGSVAAPAASIAIYADTPLSATTTIAHGTLPALAPGASTTYTATLPALPSGAHTLYVAVNPNRSVAETGYANNLASLAIRTAAIAATGGWSLIDLPLTATGPVSASTILQGVLHSSAGHLAAIYGLSNGRWSPSLIQQGSGATSGTDFALQPGQGYLLYTDTGTSYTPAAGAAGQVQRQGGRGAGARLATLVEPGRAERPGGRTRRALQRNRGAVALWIRRA